MARFFVQYDHKCLLLKFDKKRLPGIDFFKGMEYSISKLNILYREWSREQARGHHSNLLW